MANNPVYEADSEEWIPENGDAPEWTPPNQEPVPGPRSAPTTSPSEAGWRGLAQGLTGFLGEEIEGAVQTAVGHLPEFAQQTLSLVGNREGFNDMLRGGKVHPIRSSEETQPPVLQEYRQNRDAARAENEMAGAEHPGIYGTTRVVGAVPGAVATGALNKAATMGLGAVAGVAGSDAELTPDRVTPQSFEDARTAAYTGAIAGGVAKQFPTLAKYGFPALGAGLAVGGEELGMTPADRVSAGVGAMMSVPGLAGDFLEGQAARTRPLSQKARTELTEDFQSQDLVDDAADAKTMDRLLKAKQTQLDAERRDVVKRVRADEDADFKAQQAELRKQNQLGKLDDQEASIQTRRGFKAASKALGEYESEQKQANQAYVQWFKERAKEIQVRAKVRQDRAKSRQELLNAIQDAEAEMSELQASANAARAKAFDTAATRLERYPGRVGEDLPEEAGPLASKVADSYRNNTNWNQLDPDYVQAQYLESRAPQIQSRAQAARQRLTQFDETPFDEEAAIRESLNKTSLVDRQEAYNKARELGLDPGTLEQFNPVPNPKNSYRLNRPRPEDPEPLPDPDIARLQAIDTRRAAIQEPRPEPARRSETDILQEAGLDRDVTLTGDDYVARADTRTPIQDRINQVIENVRPGAMSQVQNATMKGALSGAGLGVLGGTQVPAVQALGPGVLGPAGAYLGARGALRTLTDITPEGRFKNPAQVAAVMESLDRALTKYPELGRKYLGAFSNGVRPIQIMFYIQNDPELARALDEEAQQ